MFGFVYITEDVICLVEGFSKVIEWTIIIQFGVSSILVNDPEQFKTQKCIHDH